MQNFMRVEFSTGIGYKAARFVVLTELPENVLEEIRAQKLSPQTRAYDRSFRNGRTCAIGRFRATDHFIVEYSGQGQEP